MTEFSFDNFEAVEKELFPQSQQRKATEYFSIKKMSVGSHKIRIVTNPQVFVKHWDDNIKRSIPCVGKDKGCPFHQSLEMEAKKTLEYVSWIIDRSDETPKIAFFNYPVIKQIAAFKKNAEYSYDVIPLYDLTIEKTEKGKRVWMGKTITDYEYKVFAGRKDTPLSQAEEDFFKKATPINDIIGRLKDKSVTVKKAVETLKEADSELPDTEAEETHSEIPF